MMVNNGVRKNVPSSRGDYLRCIQRLAGEHPARTSAIADALGRSPASVSHMLAKLAGAGLIEYARYRGARLTARGLRETARHLRRHRLIETFMVERLGFASDQARDEAGVIERVASDRFVEALADLLGPPARDRTAAPSLR